MDVDYYVSIGGCAYNALSRVETDTFSSVFAELGDKFVGFVDVLSEVSERTSCASNADLLRLYEKWLKTGSRRSGQLLVERGVVPNASITIGPYPIVVSDPHVCADTVAQCCRTSAIPRSFYTFRRLLQRTNMPVDAGQNRSASRRRLRDCQYLNKRSI